MGHAGIRSEYYVEGLARNYTNIVALLIIACREMKQEYEQFT